MATNSTRRSIPIEAGLAWSIQKRRRIEGGFPGAGRIQAALADGPERASIGIRLAGRAPARDGAEIVDEAGAVIGVVTSGGFGPSVGAPIAMGYVKPAFAADGNADRPSRARQGASRVGRTPALPSPRLLPQP